MLLNSCPWAFISVLMLNRWRTQKNNNNYLCIFKRYPSWLPTVTIIKICSDKNMNENTSTALEIAQISSNRCLLCCVLQFRRLRSAHLHCNTAREDFLAGHSFIIQSICCYLCSRTFRSVWSTKLLAVVDRIRNWPNNLG